MNISNIMDTDMNDDLVFLLYPLSINSINKDIRIHIINVGMVGLNPQPTIIIKNIIRIKLIYIVINVFKPLLPPIVSKRINNISDSSFIILQASFYIKVSL